VCVCGAGDLLKTYYDGWIVFFFLTSICFVWNIQFDDLWKSLFDWLEAAEDNLQKFVVGVGARTKQDFDELHVRGALISFFSCHSCIVLTTTYNFPFYFLFNIVFLAFSMSHHTGII